MERFAYLYVIDGMADWEPALLLAELNSGRSFREPDTRLPVRTIGATADPIVTIGGVRIVPDMAFADADMSDAAILVLPGSDDWQEDRNRPVLDAVEGLLARDVIVAAICGATVGLASVGLLDDRPHTSNDLQYLQHLVPSYAGGEHYVSTPVVRDGSLVTANGVAPVEFARETLAALDVMSEAALDAWLRLYTRHDPADYADLMAALPTADV